MIKKRTMNFLISILTLIATAVVTTASWSIFYQPEVPKELLKK